LDRPSLGIAPDLRRLQKSATIGVSEIRNLAALSEPDEGITGLQRTQ